MLKSMTGFGTSKISNEEFEIKIDIKSVNNRYLDISIKGPKSIIFMEEDLKKIISSKAKRGKVDCFIDIRFLDRSNNELQVDKDLLLNYDQKIKEMSNIVGSDKNYNIIDLLKYDSNLLTIEKKN